MSLDSQASAYRDQILLVARVLIGILFVVAAYYKMIALGGTAGYLGRLGVPAPGLVAPLIMILEAAAGILLIVGFQTRLAALFIAAFVIVAALLAHTKFSDTNQLNHFLKNLAIAGGCLALFVTGPGSLSVDKR